MQIKTTKTYKDKHLERMVKADEVLAVSDERGKYLISIGYAKEEPLLSKGAEKKEEAHGAK